MSLSVAVLAPLGALAVAVLPRRWGALPLLAGACYTAQGDAVAIGPFHFSVLRLLVAVSMLRVTSRGEWRSTRLSPLDGWFAVWAGWACLSSVFHEEPPSALVFRLGLVYDVCGLYASLRVFCRDVNEVIGVCRGLALLLMPIAVAMLHEKVTGFNLFSVVGGTAAVAVVRDGTIRAGGPFGHPILAGTIGAVCVPMMSCLWRYHRGLSALGVLACLAIIFASASSGPIMSLAAAVLALVLWRARPMVRPLLWLVPVLYVALAVVMSDPPYYLMARIDVVGGSTGYHRARLIESSIEHLGEWWMAGTDRTRHWMATGVPWSSQHTDITNHYLRNGVVGGLPLMALFIGGLGQAVLLVRRQLGAAESRAEAFAGWSLGAGLFAHIVTCVSVAYFDQSIIFLLFTQAAVASLATGDGTRRPLHEARSGKFGTARGRAAALPTAKLARRAGGSRRELPPEHQHESF